MKPIRLLSLLLLLGVFFLSCEKEELSRTSKNKKHSSLRTTAAECACVVSNHHDETILTYSYDRGVIVEVWNDETTIYYRAYRYDLNANNANNMVHIGALYLDGSLVALVPTSPNVYNWTKSAVGLNTCDHVSTGLKFDGVSGNGPATPIVVTLDYTVAKLCITQQCTYTYDTGFGGSTSGAGPAWWYSYAASDGSQPVYAGQTKLAGSVTIDGSGNYTITLASGWSLKSGESESVKIQGYDVLPSSRPAAGQFSGPSSYKGTSLTGSVSPKPYYVIHLDLQECHLD
ncbi:MAG: hypothetical protein V4683_05785 [Bacteroidota bacterium]